MDFEKIHADGEDFVIPVPKSYRDCAELIKSDYYRHGGRHKSLLGIWINGLTRISMGFSFWFRLSQYKGWLYPFTRWRLRIYKHRYGLFIPKGTRIGYGLYIQHCYGIIINKTAVIGNNVNMGQFTTIGTNVERAAIIGNNVYIGANVNIIDDVVIHSNSSIGTAAAVTHNVESGTTVVGIPARPINVPHHVEFIRNPWPYELPEEYKTK